MNSYYLPPPRRRLAFARLLLFLVSLTLLFAALVIGGIFQIYRYWPTLSGELQNTYYGDWELPAHRGNIFDRNKRPLAMNADEYHAVAELRMLRVTRDEAALRRLAAELAEVLDETEAAMVKKLMSQKDFVYLKKSVSPAVAARLRRMNVRGLRTRYESRRFYPNGEYFAHLVGYTDHKGLGRGGVEYLRRAHLTPHAGAARLLRTSQGEPLREIAFRPAKDGGDWRLAIDSRLQYFAYEALRTAVTKHGARGAAAIVMDVDSGGLLAVANYPSFNPNNILRADERLRNRALADVVEPGSTVKPFVVAMALEEGLTTEKEKLPTTTPLRIGRLLVRDKHIREELDVVGVVGKSSNIGAVLLASRLGKQRLWRGYQKLGFDGGAILSLPEERAGLLRDYKEWRREDFATHAYGYGFSTTLLQLLAAYSVFAADGLLRRPFLESGGYGRDVRVFSAKTARRVRTMMEQVTTAEGTARAAAVFGYRVAGKTGTAYKFDGGQYSDKKVRAFFVGMAPASRPRYLIAVMIDEPRRNGRTGGATAAPAFQQIMRRALLLGGVAPDALPPAPAPLLIAGQ